MDTEREKDSVRGIVFLNVFYSDRREELVSQQSIGYFMDLIAHL